MNYLKLILENKAEKKNFRIENAQDSANIYVYDVISADWGVSAMDVIASISEAGEGKTLNIHINSPGGDVFEGRAIMAAISAYKGKTVAKIDSLCASAATSIALACDEVEMSDGAFFMIHNASGFVWGDKSAMRETADLLEKIEGAIVNDYTAKTGKEEDEIRQMMDVETWMSASEALENGFIDRISDSKATKNTWNLSAFNKPPAVEPTEETEEIEEPHGYSTTAFNKLRLLELNS